MFTLDEKVIIWLDVFDSLTIKKKYEILNAFESPKKLYDEFKNSFNKLQPILTKEEFNKMNYALNDQFIESQIASYNKLGVTLVTINSASYSKLLLQTATPPLVLYCKGDISLLNTESIAVVGTRRPTSYGAKVAEKFVRELAQNNFTIVSGMVYGVDTIAHNICLKEGGKTIAVLGGGVNEVYPKSNINLSEEIIKNGLLISEYKPHTKPVRYHFPARNRIIAGLSKGTFIPEAARKSGSMYTKEYCLEAGRDLFVVPGNIYSTVSEGTNDIIKNLQGAMVTSPEDILDLYGKTNKYKKQEKANSYQLSFDEQQLVNLLTKEDMHYEELMNFTKFDSKTLNTLLTTMQVRGIIKKLAGNIYTLN